MPEVRKLFLHYRALDHARGAFGEEREKEDAVACSIEEDGSYRVMAPPLFHCNFGVGDSVVAEPDDQGMLQFKRTLRRC